jgi:hypothetical protein
MSDQRPAYRMILAQKADVDGYRISLGDAPRYEYGKSKSADRARQQDSVRRPLDSSAFPCRASAN